MKMSMRKTLLALVFLMLISVSWSYAESYVRLLKKVPLMTDSLTLKKMVGKPTRKESVLRYYYGPNQAVVEDSVITDIRLAPVHKKLHINLKRQKNSARGGLQISSLRIGMKLSEAYNRVGLPDSVVSGNDWYYSNRHRVELSQGKVSKIDLHLKSTMETLDWIWLNFSKGGLFFMNITLALIMFGVALQIKVEHFKMLITNPKPVLVGFISQFFALPFFTFLLVLLIRPTPSIAMGMILVAACPGGNISNFISSLAKGNIALSVTLTAIATTIAVFMTPFNFAFWGSLYSRASNLVIPIQINPWEMIKTVLILLGLPVVLGMLFAHYFPKITGKISNPIKYLSIIIFLGYVVAALASNFNYFLKYVHLIVLIVIVHNALGLLVGYTLPTIFKLNPRDRRTISIETGIQNSGLGLVLIFNPNLFDGLGGMAFIAALWGIWHIISGLGIAYYWSRKPLPSN
ncbi:MAG TPA: bile acid:sodium symporter family protein [Tenuifilaceae bacterium]|nr:bile acid:sodium symporter family protein [Tenuifilaceae bacterium]